MRILVTHEFALLIPPELVLLWLVGTWKHLRCDLRATD